MVSGFFVCLVTLGVFYSLFFACRYYGSTLHNDIEFTLLHETTNIKIIDIRKAGSDFITDPFLLFFLVFFSFILSFYCMHVIIPFHLVLVKFSNVS